jgi:pimeloyl-ACP methyl ester carboxylesterase
VADAGWLDAPVPPVADEEPVTFPGAVAPDRTRPVDSSGLRIAAYEWGAPDAPPLFLVHGGFDFARTFDQLAPRLAAAGWRVISWDQRGHGDSEHAPLYSLEADVRDAVAVMETVTGRAAPVVGHSKGGGLMLQLADTEPFRFSHFVNMDGLPTRRPAPDVADHDRTRMLASDLEAWLDHRRRSDAVVRKAGTLDELARRRGRMNPRLSHEWLRYLVTVGARRDPDGWRWKIDAIMRFGGFGPWRPEWSMLRMPGLVMPFLAVIGQQPEQMSWGTRPEDVIPNLPYGGRLEVLEHVGHFVHIEQPDRIATLVLDFLAAA